MTEKKHKTIIDFNTSINFSIGEVYYKLVSLTWI